MNPLRWDVLLVGLVLSIPVLAMGMRGDLSIDEVMLRVPWCLLAGWGAIALLRFAGTPPKRAPKNKKPRPIDLVKDPIEPSSARGESLMKCVADGSDLAGVVAAKQCGAVRCANTSAGLTSGGCCLAGGSLAGTDMGSRHQSICQVAHCQASVSETGASSGGNPLTACGCSGSYTTPGVPPGGPSGGYLPPVESPFPPAGVPPH